MAKKLYAKRAGLYELYEAVKGESESIDTRLFHNNLELRVFPGCGSYTSSIELNLKTGYCNPEKYKPFLYDYIKFMRINNCSFHNKRNLDQEFSDQANSGYVFFLIGLLDQLEDQTKPVEERALAAAKRAKSIFGNEKLVSPLPEEDYEKMLTVAELVRKKNSYSYFEIQSLRNDDGDVRSFGFNPSDENTLYYQSKFSPITKDDFDIFEEILSSYWNIDIADTQWSLACSKKRIILPEKMTKAQINMKENNRKLKDTINSITKKKKRWWQF